MTLEMTSRPNVQSALSGGYAGFPDINIVHYVRYTVR